MKTILKNSIATSLLLLCLSVSVFADGQQSAGSKTGGSNGGGLAPTANNDVEITLNSETPDQQNVRTYLDWFSTVLFGTFR